MTLLETIKTQFPHAETMKDVILSKNQTEEQFFLVGLLVALGTEGYLSVAETPEEFYKFFKKTNESLLSEVEKHLKFLKDTKV
jgi:hypothetical protein